MTTHKSKRYGSCVSAAGLLALFASLSWLVTGCYPPGEVRSVEIATTAPPPPTLASELFEVTATLPPVSSATYTPTLPPTVTLVPRRTATQTPGATPSTAPTTVVGMGLVPGSEATIGAATATSVSRQETIYEQKDWTAPGSYATASRLDTTVEGKLRLGSTLPAPAPYAELSQDGYPDIVFSNYYNNQTYLVNSYIYWGSADGYSTGRRTELPTMGTRGVAVADLNRDGLLDIVFANLHDDAMNYRVNNYIYWGREDGYHAGDRSELPGSGSGLGSVADLDADGWLDIIFSNHYLEDHVHEMDSYIYWGGASGFSASDRTSLPILGAYANTPADVNGDGWLDIVFSNHRLNNDASFEIGSYIYWGGPNRFSPENRAEIATQGATDSAVFDLNGDGYLDLLFSNFRDNTSREAESWIYWGSSTGYDGANRTSLPTQGATTNSIGDLDKDGFVDIVFSQFRSESTYQVGSEIYWGSGAGFTTDNHTTLDTIGAVGNSLADLNRDGWLDIVFSNFMSSQGFQQDSWIYWGSAGGYGSDRRTALPTLGAYDNTVVGGMLPYGHKGLGTTYSQPTGEWRVPRTYAAEGSLVSLPFGGTPHEWSTIAWECTLPRGTEVAVDVSTSDDGATWSEWIRAAESSADGANQAALSVGVSRFIRYRLMLRGSSSHTTTPAVTSVRLTGWKEASSCLFVPWVTKAHRLT
ncbi:MAG: VCBS repeat-containing protein [Anaerolineae bacterium]|nr:VCBS repeat-containing protein [Anaerolineae bacterium]